MQNRNFGALRRLTLGVMALMLVAAFLLGASISHPTTAQEPTPTPSDPTWRGLGAARAALEEKFNTDLTYVRAWTFAQTEWKLSIDECDEEIAPNDYRPVYFGWVYGITSLGGRVWRVNVSYDLKAVTICTREEVAAAGGSGAPVPTNPDLPAPVAGSGATGSFELGAHIFAVDAPAITAMQTSGMTWMKFQVRYDLGEGPEEAAGLINAAKSNGFKVLLSIVGHSYDMDNYDSYITTFAAYLGQVAAAGPDAIEVWNEPNLDREWPIGKVSGSEYTRMLAAGFNAIKAANPAVIVISAAPSPTGFGGAAGCVQTDTYHVCNDDTFFQQMAQAGAANYMDCVGSHYNEGIIAPSATTGDPRDGYPTRFFGGNLGRARAYISNRPICLTEIGYVTPEGYGPIAPGFAWGANTTVAQQAAWLAEAASISAGLGYVRLMIVWNINAQQYNENDPQAGYAIIRPGGSCPACSALGSVMGK